jgi:LmbE family N-acetylglucosaminyl deacetylase
MARHVSDGDHVAVVIFAEGFTSRQASRDRGAATEELGLLRRSAMTANEILGVTDVALYDFPDNRMDSMDMLDVVKAVEFHVERVRPDTVYAHSATDVNIDHRTLHEAVIAATRPMPGNQIKHLLFFEVPSSTEWQTPGSAPSFLPNWYVDVTGTLDLKLKALQAYDSEMRCWPHPRSIRNVEYLARVRGATVGVEAAEAFMLGRAIYRQEEVS